jgi:phosphatidylglycerophosphate synthase
MGRARQRFRGIFPRRRLPVRNLCRDDDNPDEGAFMSDWKKAIVRSTPNGITIVRVGVVLAIAIHPEVLRTLPPIGALAVILFFYWALDFIDGVAARWLNASSKLGEGLDLIADRFCDLCLSLAVIALADPQQSLLAMAFIVARFSPDYVIGRFVDDRSRAYSGFIGEFGGSWRPVLFRTALEVIHLIRAVFFANALVPGLGAAWIDPLFAIVVLGFAGLTVNALRQLARSPSP